MADYITTDELDLFLLGAGAASTDKKDFAVTAASRTFDRLCYLPDDYFAIASGDPSTKVITGTGTTILPLPPFVGTLGTVIYQDGETEEETVNADYYILKGTIPHQFLETYRLRSLSGFDFLDYQRQRFSDGWAYQSYWRENKSYTVSARWGWTAVPDDVKTAVIEIAVAIMTNIDTAKTDRLESKVHDRNNFPVGSFVYLTAQRYGQSAASGFGI